ncbi:MAG: class I SAM-dependent methyltransferase [Methanosarcinaceae archaeon]|nr:class I SAM-dependent methyltransferase [Methanosarcinaceae archaeon]
MLLQELSGISETLYLVEESYSSQRTIESTLRYLAGVHTFVAQEKIRLIRIKKEEQTLGLFIFNPGNKEFPVDFWSVFTGALAKEPYRREFEELSASILLQNPAEKEFEISSELWRDAINEYYSLMLISRNLCPGCSTELEAYDCVFSEGRVKTVQESFEKLKAKGYSFESGKKGKMLEVCCGNGMSTLALHRMGFEPLGVEVNKCTLCQGLEHRVLNPKKALVLDATKLSEYFEPEFDFVVGFMLGLVYEFNKGLWIGIVKEAAKVTAKGGLLLFSVKSRPEIEILAKALFEVGVIGEIVDNEDSDGIFDQWLFIGRKI